MQYYQRCQSKLSQILNKNQIKTYGILTAAQVQILDSDSHIRVQTQLTDIFGLVQRLEKQPVCQTDDRTETSKLNSRLVSLSVQPHDLQLRRNLHRDVGTACAKSTGQID